MSQLNYRHLHYFWVVAKEGGLARAADRLGMAVQTVSAQVKALEMALGHQLFKPQGRGLVLTEAGQAAFARAEEIFQIGQLIPAEVHQAATGHRVRLAVGLSDGISKLAAHALLEPVLSTPSLKLVCHEGEVEELLSELALHHLDLVLAGQPAPPNPNLRLSSRRIAVSEVDWYGPGQWVSKAASRRFPDCLQELPVLLPTGHSALRASVDRWLEQHGLRPQVAGEFEDSALMAVFASGGMGVFPVSRLGNQELGLMRELRLLGRCDDLHEEVYAIRSRRSQHHPLVQRLMGEDEAG
ncbi:LysR family transcriptional regulator [Pelomonas sp. CA6]|uniref:LysR family transcriptional regulator n=1 Tax=Pelomonas sp. CA6 TaxID=2907999 RepID=UPI001F4B32D4|nr:LysR family transcriptional regulator [Pelomonas sp. CA6]MCH7342849.1 LysR family transcriptional regulator [Pelomonas sp. CA6]